MNMANTQDFMAFVTVCLLTAAAVLCTDSSFQPHYNQWPSLPYRNHTRLNSPFETTTVKWSNLGKNSWAEVSNQRPSWLQPATERSRVNVAALGPRGNVAEQRSAVGAQVDVTDDELRDFAENLLREESNEPGRYLEVKYQGRTSSRSTKDEAPEKLLQIQPGIYNIKTISKLMQLFDNYLLDTNLGEDYTNQERNEEEEFLNEVLNTAVFKATENFLVSKGKVSNGEDFKNKIREIWFTMYRRGGRGVGSSGFEHIFLTEIKNNQVSGLHNWIYFDQAESKNLANYLGYLHKIEIGDQKAILKHHFNFNGIDKPVGTMFVGTTPEFEMALYTTCFLIRADRICPLRLNGKRLMIRTFTYRYKGKNLIGSAFPEI